MSDDELMSDEELELLSEEEIQAFDAKAEAKVETNTPLSVAVLARHPPVHDKLASSETTLVVIGNEWGKDDFEQAVESRGVSRVWMKENKPYKLDMAVPRVVDFNVHPKKNGADGNNYNIPLAKPETLAQKAGLSTEALARPKKLYAATYANPAHKNKFRSNQFLVVSESDSHAHTLLHQRHPNKPMTLQEIPLRTPGAIPIHALVSQ